MRQFRFLASLFVICLLPLLGCGSSESTTISGSELTDYVESNPDEIAEQERIDAMEEQEDEEEEDE